MADLTISEYAEKQGVTPQAIYKQIERYRKDLKAHLHKRGRTTFLDDYAQSFLDEKRSNNKVIIKRTLESDEIKALQEENKRLILKVNELQAQVIQVSREKEAIQAEKSALQDRVIAMLEVKAEEPKVEEPEEKPKEEAPKEEEPKAEAKRSFLYRLFHR